MFSKSSEEKFNGAGSAPSAPKRISWPFLKMNVGEVVEVDVEIAKKAAATIVVYNCKSGMVFEKRTDSVTGNLYVKRIK